MSMITRQWIGKGQGVRNRSFSPVGVRIRAQNPTDTWSRSNKIAVEIEITASLGDYRFQQLYLTADDAEKVAKTLLSACGDDVRGQIVRELLADLTNDELLQTLSADLRKRVK